MDSAEQEDHWFFVFFVFFLFCFFFWGGWGVGEGGFLRHKTFNIK